MTAKSFDINSIITKGKDDVREYKLPAGTVLIRPLTELEMEECELAMLDSIEDPEVREFVLNASQEDFANAEDKEEEFDDKNMNYTQFFKASTAFMLKIAYMAMKDFADDDFTPEDLKRVAGIKNLATEVQRISGYTQEVVEDIENFRE